MIWEWEESGGLEGKWGPYKLLRVKFKKQDYPRERLCHQGRGDKEKRKERESSRQCEPDQGRESGGGEQVGILETGPSGT